MKKILFLDTKKLAGLSAILLLAVFCTIGMSFTPADEGENVGDPADSTYVSGPRRSHYYNNSGCGSNDNSLHYVKAIATVVGNGQVYASTAEDTPTGSSWSSSSSTSASLNCGINDSEEHGDDEIAAAHNMIFYLFAIPSDGYFFKGWSSTSPTYTEVSTDNPYTFPITIGGSSQVWKWGTQTGDWNSDAAAYKETRYAFFSPVTVDNVTPDSKDLAPENARTDYEYTGTIAFETTGADDLADFDVLDFSQDGNGTFTITSGPTLSGSHVTLEYKFVGSGVYGTRTNRATFTLSSKATDANPPSKTCIVKANYPNVGLSGSDVEVNTITEAAATSGSFTVNTMFADGTDDFTSIPSAFSNTSGTSGTWTLNSYTFNGTDFATGEGSFTVNYTFTPGSTEGITTAEFTLTAKDGVGGESKTILLTANVEAPELEYEASVTIGSGEPYKYEHLSEAIEAANAVAFNLQAPVVKLLRDVTVNSPLELSRTMKLDLNAFTLTGNLSASATSVLLIENQNAIVTLCSERAGGKLIASGNYAGRLSAVEVNKGKFVLQSGDVVLSNSDNGAAADKLYACGVYLSMSQHDSYDRPTSAMQMTGGSITVNRPNGGSYAYGIYCDGAGKNSSAADLRNATITTTVTGGSYAYGAFLAGESPVNNMTITANANKYAYGVWVNDGARVVMENGQYTANVVTSQARAVNSHGSLQIQSGKYVANNSAEDDLSDVTGSDAVAVNVTVGTAVINDGTFIANATTSAYALQLYANSGTPSANIADGSFTAKAKTSNAAAVHVTDNTSVVTTGGTYRGIVWRSLTSAADLNAYGLLAEGANSSVTLSNSNLSATLSQPLGNNAFGVKTAGALSIERCAITATATNNEAYGLRCNGGTITDCNLTANAGGTGAYGIYTEQTAGETNVSGTTFRCESKLARAFGGYIYGGTFTAENCTFEAKAQAEATAAGASTLRGILFQTGATGALNNCEITATGNASYSQTGYGVYDKGTATIDNTTIVVKEVKSDGYAIMVESATAAVRSGHFKAPTKALHISSPISIELSGGFWSSNANLSSYLKSGYSVYDVPSTSSDRENGYLYSIGTPDAPGYSVCKNVETRKTYLTLAEALQEVQANQTIVLTQNCALPKGDFVLPQYATLLVPYYANQTIASKSEVERTAYGTGYVTPSQFRRLTLLNGANLLVYGEIEAGGVQHGSGSGDIAGPVQGPYGRIQMDAGATMTLESGANLYAWGYVTGEGNIYAKNGSKSYEMFQLGWYKGGNTTKKANDNKNTYKIFPFTDFAYQNIECPITYYPGATGLGSGAVAASYSVYPFSGVKLVGTTDDSFFKMDVANSNSETWVRKEYDATTDMTEWFMNSGAKISGITMNVGVTVSSNGFYLPIPCNFTIIMNYGEVTIANDVEFLPGSKLIVNKEATGIVAAGKYAFFYDNEDWFTGLGAVKKTNPSKKERTCGKYYYPVPYSPSWETPTKNPRLALYAQTKAKLDAGVEPLPDAELFLHGKLVVNGYLYTTGDGTTDRASNIHSTNEDAGKIIFNTSVPTSEKTMYKLCYAIGQSDTDNSWNNMIYDGNSTSTPARLKNGSAWIVSGEDEFTTTSGTTSGKTFIYQNNHWSDTYEEGCFTVKEIDEVKHYFAHPADFVEVTSKEEDIYHLYRDTETGERAFLKEDGCVWWEVEPAPYDNNKYKTVIPDHNGLYKYYAYDATKHWQEARVKVTWKNGDTKISDYNVLYRTSPKYLDATVTKTAPVGHTYFWDGWVLSKEDETSSTCRVYANDELPEVTQAITYYAHFKLVTNRYTVRFLDTNGSEIEKQSVEYGVVPECTALPTREATDEVEYILSWSPAITAASVDINYTAVFTPQARMYAITFANYNSDVLKQEDVAYGTVPVAPQNPTRQNDGFYSYDFTGWKSGKVYVDKDESLPVVTGAATYTAQYATTDWTPVYRIVFQDEDGTTLQTQNVRQGNELTDPSEALLASGKLMKAEDVGHTYEYDSWSPELVMTPTGDATYTATYRAVTTKQYTIIFKDDDDVVLQSSAFDYGTVPTYNRPQQPVKDITAEFDYEFSGWKDADENIYTDMLPNVIGEAAYTAVYTPIRRKYLITFKNGTAQLDSKEVEYGTLPVYTGVVPTKDPDATYYYAFDGWQPELSPVTSAMTYNAHFSQTTQTYVVTWKTEDGNSIYRADSEVPAGSIPVYGTEDEPTKGSTLQWNYTYDGWSTSQGGSLVNPLPALTKDAIFYAHFAQTTRTYTVTWKNEDGTTLETDEKVEYGATPHYDGATPTKAGNETNVYTFKSWDKNIAAVTGDVTYTATYTSAETAASVTASGNTAYFTSIDDAFADAGTKRDATIKILKSLNRTTDPGLTYASSLTNNTCVLDLNGKTISINALSPKTDDDVSTGTLNINAAGTTFTIKNGTLQNARNGRARYTVVVVSAGNLIVDNAVITINNTANTYTDDSDNSRDRVRACAIRMDAGTLTVKSGTIQSTASTKPYGIWLRSGSSVNIDGGTISATVSRDSCARAIYVDGGELTVTNGSITATSNLSGSKGAYGVYVNSGNATVNGGLISAVSNTINAYDVYLTNNGMGIIGGGKFKVSGTSNVGGVNGTVASNKLDISGGFYTHADNLAKYAKKPYGLRALESDDDEYAEGYRHEVSSTFDITVDETTGSQTLEVSVTASKTTVDGDVQLTVPTGNTLTTKNLIITTTTEEDKSAELVGNVEMSENGKAYIDFNFDDAEPRHWHAFSVPFQVDLKKSGRPAIINGETLTLGRGYDIVYYDGAERAKHGKSAACWKYVEDPAPNGGDSILYPGRAYMIASASRALKRIRFTKASGAALMNNTVDVSANISETSDDKDGGWNGIGNPKLSHAVLDAGVALCQVHDGRKIGEDGYMPYVLDDKKLVVGRAVFVQVGEDPSVVVKSANGKEEIEQYVNPAPRRASAKNKEDRYEVMIASSNGTMADRVFLLFDEEKEDKYVILEDVAKAGVSPVRAQMWVDRYGEKLCMNTTALINGKANYPLTIAAPKAGEYEISLNGQAKEGTTLYLTYDGKAIWNLTYGGYTAALEKGTNTHYGLRIVINKVATEIEQTTIENGDAVRKVIVNDKVYIIRNGEIYSITGQKAQ